MSHPQNSRFSQYLHRRWIAYAGLFVGLALTALSTYFLKSKVDDNAQLTFVAECNEIKLNIGARLESCAQILMAGAALFNASVSVEREEWRAFTKGLRLENQLSGIQGVGYALIVPPRGLEQHIKEIRNQGFPDYDIRPSGQREVYTSIIYIEPFSDRNLRAFGYDMYSEPLRRAAMDRACQENSCALSRKIVLVQETGKEVQAGTLMYMPIYRKGLPITNTAERQAAIMGWVYSPYRMTDLINGVAKKIRILWPLIFSMATA